MPDRSLSLPDAPIPSDAVLVLVGRRVDLPGATVCQFPASHVDRVARRLASLFASVRPTGLVCSAACGADLLALEAAGAMGIPRHVVLPFDAARFRRTSVTDRPGEWGARFDRVLADVPREGGLTILRGRPDDTQAYARVNARLVRVAQRWAAEAGRPLAAVLVWEGRARASRDLTAEFQRLAVARGWPFTSVVTDDAE